MSADETVGLRLEVEEEHDSVVVHVAGELDLSSVSEFAAELDAVLEHSPPEVQLDMSQLHFIDSSGVGAYVSAFRRARDAGTKIWVGPRSPFVERVLQISGVEDALAAESS